MSENQPLKKDENSNSYGADKKTDITITESEKKEKAQPIDYSQKTLTDTDIHIIKQLIEYKSQLDIIEKLGHANLVHRDLVKSLKVLKLVNDEPENIQKHFAPENIYDEPVNIPIFDGFKHISNKPRIIKHFADIKDFLEQNEGLDIYQWFAFAAATHQFDSGCCGWCGYLMSLTKVLLMAFVQIASVIVLYIYAVEQSDSTPKGWCNGEGDTTSRIMAICYSYVLSIAFMVFFIDQETGFYKNLSPLKEGGFSEYGYSFLSTNWLVFGKLINYAVLLNAVYLSFCIIMITDDPLDIVLNSMAILFICELDNMVVSKQDYSKILEFFEDEEKINVMKDKLESNCANVCRTCCFCNIMWLALLSKIVMFAAPFVIGYCY